MSVHSSGSICVHVCVYVKHTRSFLKGGNSAPLALQQLTREETLKIVTAIHTEQRARAEKKSRI